MTQSAYTAGMQPFRPNGKQLLDEYYEVPVDILEDAEQLTDWALRAITTDGAIDSSLSRQFDQGRSHTHVMNQELTPSSCASGPSGTRPGQATSFSPSFTSTTSNDSLMSVVMPVLGDIRTFIQMRWLRVSHGGTMVRRTAGPRRPSNSPSRLALTAGGRMPVSRICRLHADGRVRQGTRGADGPRRNDRTAIMCAEAVPWRCHRSLVADALSHEVGTSPHILGAGRGSCTSSQPSLVMIRAGRVIYPAPSDQCSTLRMFLNISPLIVFHFDVYCTLPDVVSNRRRLRPAPASGLCLIRDCWRTPVVEIAGLVWVHLRRWSGASWVERPVGSWFDAAGKSQSGWKIAGGGISAAIFHPCCTRRRGTGRLLLGILSYCW